MDIVGGSYYEYCFDPYWAQLFGSGVRAAAALGELSSARKLFSALSKRDKPTAELYANTYNYSLDLTETAETISFEYIHPLASPILDLKSNRDSFSKEVKSECLLVFGTLESKFIVYGKNVVYDPQSPRRPTFFEDSGSTAENLVIVLNKSEALELAKQKNIEAAAKVLLEKKNVRAVVIKLGPIGALVFTPGNTEFAPAYKTSSVFPIGSGDVFSSLFAFFWAEQKLSPIQAARNASLGTAYYCETKTLPIPKTLFEGNPLFPELEVSPFVATEKPPTIYLAGPFFSLAQRWIIQQARSSLIQQGVNVFSPLHDVGLGPAHKVVPADLSGIESSRALLAVDSNDTGTIFEMGYASKQGIPVTCLTVDTPQSDLKMIVGAGAIITNDFSTAIYRCIWSALENV